MKPRPLVVHVRSQTIRELFFHNRLARSHVLQGTFLQNNHLNGLTGGSTRGLMHDSLEKCTKTTRAYAEAHRGWGVRPTGDKQVLHSGQGNAPGIHPLLRQKDTSNPEPRLATFSHQPSLTRELHAEHSGNPPASEEAVCLLQKGHRSFPFTILGIIGPRF